MNESETVTTCQKIYKARDRLNLKEKSKWRWDVWMVLRGKLRV